MNEAQQLPIAPVIPEAGGRYRITDFVGATYEGVVSRVLIAGRDEGVEAGHVRIEFSDGDVPAFTTNLPLTAEEIGRKG